MKSIALVVAYFGQLNNYYEYWINSCRNNPTIDWLVFSDNPIFLDKQLIPDNMKVYPTTFEQFKNRIAQLYDFNISLEEPYKICDYRVAFGELLEDKELSGYDYWGYCDTDLIWGDIRYFLNDQLLQNYEKIGLLGHFTLFHNTHSNNRIYRKDNSNGADYYKKVFTSNNNCNFDEIGIDDTYLYNDISIYSEIHFADLADLRHNFKMWFHTSDKKYNRNFIFQYENKNLYRVYIKDNQIIKEKIMYVHFHNKKTLSVDSNVDKQSYLIIPNEIVSNAEITISYIKEITKPHWFRFYKELLSKQKSLYHKLKWLGYSIKYNLYLHFSNNKLNYWLWTDYNNAKRIDVFNYHKH